MDPSLLSPTPLNPSAFERLVRHRGAFPVTRTPPSSSFLSPCAFAPPRISPLFYHLPPPFSLSLLSTVPNIYTRIDSSTSRQYFSTASYRGLLCRTAGESEQTERGKKGEKEKRRMMRCEKKEERDIDSIRGELLVFLTDMYYILGWQVSNCGFFLENQRQFFHGTK